MKWAINKKIEKERNARGDPMDCDDAEDAWPMWYEEDWYGYQQWPEEDWKDDGSGGSANDGEMREEDKDAAEYINHKGKGGMKGFGKGYPQQWKGGTKGYGKGFPQHWKGGMKGYGKGMKGGGKGFGKGKGKGKGECYICGKTGHMARERPQRGN